MRIAHLLYGFFYLLSNLQSLFYCYTCSTDVQSVIYFYLCQDFVYVWLLKYSISLSYLNIRHINVFYCNNFSVEMATLTRRNDKTMVENLTSAEVSQLIKEHEEREKEQEAQQLV